MSGFYKLHLIFEDHVVKCMGESGDEYNVINENTDCKAWVVQTMQNNMTPTNVRSSEKTVGANIEEIIENLVKKYAKPAPKPEPKPAPKL